MKEYYKGMLCSVDSIKNLEYEYAANIFDGYGFFRDSRVDYELFSNFDKKTEWFARECLCTRRLYVGIINYFNKKLNDGNIDFKTCNKRYIEIIYELVNYDNCLFGKEVFTGLMFPLIQSNFEFEFHENVEENKSILLRQYREGKIWLSLKEKSDLFDKINNVIINSSPAKNMEVAAYLNKFEKGLFAEKQKISYFNSLKKIYSANIFKNNLSDDDIKKEKQISITILMENIEFLIKQVTNSNEKAKFKEKYKEILEASFSTAKSLSIGNLVALKTEIETYLSFNKQNANSLDSYLENIKREYLLNLIENNSKKTDLTIEELDKYYLEMAKWFSKAKNSYGFSIDQEEMLKMISLLYLFELIKNKDSIDIKMLENGYFKDNIKSIILGIKSLQEMGILEDDTNLYLDSDTSIINVVNAIKELKVKKTDLEESKRLIKLI